jgi:hypothetical protein
MNAPILTIRSNVSPYSLLTTPIVYSETVALQSSLPVLSGDYSTGIVSSDVITFRIYNNFYPYSSNIATAYNIYITTFDGASSVSHTATTSSVSQCWTYFMENGFGENSSPQSTVMYTHYQDIGEYVGGSMSTKIPTYGSDGSTNPYIRAGQANNGEGMIEFNTKVSPSLFEGFATYSFAWSINYEWIS